MNIPALTIFWIGIKFDAYTIEFGGVATGNINAQLAEIVNGKISRRGSMPIFNPTLATTGKNVIVVVKLLVSSVSKTTMTITVSKIIQK